MFAQDHQLQVCTEPFQTRMKIKFKSQISCGFGFFSSSFRRCCFPSFLREKREAKPPRLHVRRTRSLCTSSHSGQLGGCGMVGAGTGHSTPSTAGPPPGCPGPGTDAMAHVPFCLFTDRQQCLPAHPEALRGGGSCSWRGMREGGSAMLSEPGEPRFVYPAVASPAKTPWLDPARGHVERSSLSCSDFCARGDLEPLLWDMDARAAKSSSSKPRHSRCHAVYWWHHGEYPGPVPPGWAGSCSTRCTCHIPAPSSATDLLCVLKKSPS